MYKAYKFRIYPNDIQKELIESKSMLYLGMTVLAFFVSYILSEMLTRPIKNMMEVTTKISNNDLKNFRVSNSKTPGHPEYGHTAGVETTTGPLGQGIANAVGMAIGETMLASRFNEKNAPLFDNYTYVLCGDGCLQEGVALEALSLCGHQKLEKFILLFDFSFKK